MSSHEAYGAMTTQTSNNQQRAAHLDGLRGCASVMVLLGHLAMMVWPATLVAETYPAGTPDWQLTLAASPLSAIWDGRLAVSIFFVLSGYVLTAATISRPLSFPALACKRYLRLLLPVLAATVPTLLLQPLGWYFNHDLAFVTGSTWLDTVTSTGFEPSLWHWLRNAVWMVFFVDGHTSYNALLWTMRFEFLGSLLVFLLAGLVSRAGWRLAIAAALLVLVVHLPSYAILYLFLAGMMLHDLASLLKGRGDKASRLFREVAGWSLVALGLYLPRLVMVMIGGHGAGLAFLLWLRATLPAWQGDRWMLAAAPLVAGVMLAPSLRHLLSRPFCRWLGRISFPLYLFHLPLIMSLGSWLMLTLLARIDFAFAVWLTFIVTGVAALLLAWLMTPLIETPSLRLAARIGAIIDGYWSRLPAWCQLSAVRRIA